MVSYDIKNQEAQSKSVNRNTGKEGYKGQSHDLPRVQQSVTIQQKADTTATPVQNNTGLPNSLKAGIENLSGFAMDDVKVHYNSAKPAQLNAHPYAQGTDIHLASGQKKHLPHEAWHVVQQKQGRVKPTMQMNGANINDSPGLEKEADAMGGKALQMRSKKNKSRAIVNSAAQKKNDGKQGFEFVDNRPKKTLQLKTEILNETQTLNYYDNGAWQNQDVGKSMEAVLDVKDPRQGSAPPASAGLYKLTAPNGFVQGHLLNGHLGGRGSYDNLFPITQDANHIHSQYEQMLKGVLTTQGLVADAGAPYYNLRYKVDATDNRTAKQKSSGFNVSPRSSFILNARLEQNTTPPAVIDIIKNEKINTGLTGPANEGFNDILSNRDWGKVGTGFNGGSTAGTVNLTKHPVGAATPLGVSKKAWTNAQSDAVKYGATHIVWDTVNNRVQYFSK